MKGFIKSIALTLWQSCKRRTVSYNTPNTLFSFKQKVINWYVMTRYGTHTGSLCWRRHTDLPEPHDLLAVASIVSVNRVPLPICQIDLLHSTKHHLHKTRPNVSTGFCRVTAQLPIRRPDDNTSSSLASKYCRYCWGRTSLKPSKNACVCSSTPLDSLHSATSLQTPIHKHKWNQSNSDTSTSSPYSEGSTLRTWQT